MWQNHEKRRVACHVNFTVINRIKDAYYFAHLLGRLQLLIYGCILLSQRISQEFLICIQASTLGRSTFCFLNKIIERRPFSLPSSSLFLPFIQFRTIKIYIVKKRILFLAGHFAYTNEYFCRKYFAFSTFKEEYILRYWVLE